MHNSINTQVSLNLAKKFVVFFLRTTTHYNTNICLNFIHSDLKSNSMF